MNIRHSDLQVLNEYYTKESDKGSVLLLYGRCGLGKAETVREFIKDKNCKYYKVVNASNELQLSFYKKQFSDMDNAENYQDILEHYLSGQSEKVIVVFDEFQLIEKKNDSFTQQLISVCEQNSNIMIILISSELPWLSKEYLPKYEADKRSIMDICHMDEWGFLDLVRSFEHYSTEDLVYLYGVFGGVPSYLELIDQSRSLKENIISLVLQPNGKLFHEAENYLSAELREISVYDTILYALANGYNKLNDLFHLTGYSRAKISVYLKNLAAFDIIEKVESFETGGWSNVKKGVYVIKNQFINFWFKFVYSHQSELDTMTGEEFYDRYIAPFISEYLNPHFVNVCREFLMLMSYTGKLPIHLKSIGTWEGKQGRIDIVGQNETREKLVAKCFWQDGKVTQEEFKDLLETSKQAKIKPKYYYIFASNGFDEKLVTLSERLNSVNLIDINNF